MRISLLAVSVLAGALALPPLAPGRILPAEPPVSSQHASVSVLKCSRSAHEAVFRGRVRTIDGSERMAMRFTLLEYTGGAFKPLVAPGLGAWRSSRPAVTNFAYRQGVRGLAGDAAYRVRVDFRWYSSDDEVIARARRRSTACRQFEAVPNLRVRLTEIRETRVAGVVRYGVRLVNWGRAAASAVPVALSVDGDVIDTAIVAVVEAGEVKDLGFRGPGCEQSVEARADPDGAIVESSERDNLHRLRCGHLQRG